MPWLFWVSSLRLRRDIPIILRASYRDEALELRNKLLLERFRKLRQTHAAEDLVDPYIEPRLNQMFVPLLSVVHDEAAREELKSLARSYHRNIVADRGMGLEAQVLAVVRDLFKNAQRPYVSVAEVTQSFSQRFGTEYEGSITNRWVGGMIRRSLKLETQKSHGIYVIPLSERPKLELLYEKYGLDGDAPLGNAEPAQPRLLLSSGDVGDVGGTAGNSE